MTFFGAICSFSVRARLTLLVCCCQKGLGVGLLAQRGNLRNAIPSGVASLIICVAFFVFATWRYFRARSVLVSGFDDPMADALRLFVAVVLICIISFAIFTYVPRFAN